jgi:GDPmannose 4,6-dehydratase
MKRALITGITGQDGSYLAEFLLSKKYEVHGIIRRASTFNTHRIDHIYKDLHEPDVRLILHYGDLSDPGLLTDLIYNIKPDEIYHLGAQSHVRISFDLPEYTGNITGLSTTRLLDAIRRSGVNSKFYQASSSELFGSAEAPQNELTAFRPRSPYAIAKLYSYWMAVNFREAYGLFVSNGILFNHESPRRGEVFVTRKITRAAAHIIAGKQKKLFLGNLDSMRDWGFAPEYTEMMWLMLQHNKADDFVVGTGESHSVREFVEKAFSYTGIDIEWKGSGVDCKGIIANISSEHKEGLTCGDTVIEIDPKYYRPTEVAQLRADITKAKSILNWEPKMYFADLVKIMMDYDLLTLNLSPKMEGIKAAKAKGLHWTDHKLLDIDDINHEI